MNHGNGYAIKQIWRRADGQVYDHGGMSTGGHHTRKFDDFCKARLGRRIWRCGISS